MATGAPAQILDGKYRLLRQLASSGTVELFLGCTRGGPRKPVLVKRVAPQYAKNKPTVAGFLDEARTTARLQHGSILQVLEIGEDGGTYVAVFEHVFGASLEEVLEAEKQRKGRVPAPIALRLVASVLGALEVAHAALGDDGAPLHLVHRDVAPRNVLLGYDGAVKLGGFGLAKHDARTENTAFGVIRGQLAYASPEQLRAVALDARTDLWSAGVLLYQLLTGVLPFDRQGEFHILKAIRDEPHKPASELRQGLPAGIDALLERALAKDREARFADAAQMRRAVEETGSVARREALAEYAAELFAARLGDKAADAIAGRASVKTVVKVVGGTEVAGASLTDEDDEPTGEAQGPTGPAQLPKNATELVDLPAPRMSGERQARPPSKGEKVREPERPRMSGERTARPPSAPLPPELTPNPPAETRFPPAVELPPVPEPSRPVMPTAPPRQVARAEPKREPAAGSLPTSRKARKKKRVRFRLVTQRGFNPLIYPLAVAVAFLAAMATVRGAGHEKLVLEPLATTAPPLAVLDEAPLRPKPVGPIKPVEQPKPVEPVGEPEMQLSDSTDRGLRSGTLRVDGPRGTKVIVDRHAQGSAPVSVALAPGTHQVRYLLPNGGIKDEALKIDSGRTVHRKLQLKDIPPQPKAETWP